jgi:hypothetical protein
MAAIMATGTGINSGPQVNVYNSSAVQIAAFYAYNPAVFTTGVRVAVGDVNGDGIPDVVTVPGPGQPAIVRVWDGRFLTTANWKGNGLIASFTAFEPQWRGGAFVAVGDVNRDGFADIILGAGPGGGPHVEVFDGRSVIMQQNPPALIYSFYAYNKNFTGGVTVGSGDINNDGFADIVTGSGPGMLSTVNEYSGFNRALIRSFNPYASFSGGVNVATGFIDNDSFDDVITGPMATGGPFVAVFSGFDNHVITSFDAFSPLFHGGITVASAEFNPVLPFSFIIVGAGPGGGPQVNVYNPDGSLNSAFRAYNANYSGGVFVGGG